MDWDLGGGGIASKIKRKYMDPTIKENVRNSSILHLKSKGNGTELCCTTIQIPLANNSKMSQLCLNCHKMSKKERIQ